jgi:DNA-directed RNA polymerase subunit RPC12/RpoP
MEQLKKILKSPSKPLVEAIIESDYVVEELDLSDIHIWAEKNIVFAGQFNPTGPYKSARSPYIIEPLRAVKDHGCRQVVCLGATQTAKTVFLMLAGMWHLVNRPLPMMLIMQTNVVANDLLISRLLPTMKASRVMADLLPTDPNRIKMAANSPNSIHFDHTELYINGCSLNNLQSRPLGVILADEVWAWKGAPIEHAKKRMGSYSKKKMDKLIVCSQGGEVGSDIHKLFLQGTQETWIVPCENCNQFFQPSIKKVSADGLSWSDPKSGIKELDGSYNWSLLQEKLCMTCPQCGHKHFDNEKRKRLWLDDGRYEVRNLKARKDKRSFNWNAWIERPWIEIIEEFVNASHDMKKGVYEPMKNYFWQTEAEIKPPEDHFASSIKIREGDYNPKDKWEHEFVRFMTVDVQKDKFAYLIRAWAKDGRSRLLTYAYVYTIEEVISAQKEWGVPSYYTWIDTGHRTHEVYRYIAQNEWVGIKGEYVESGYWQDILDAEGNKVGRMRLYWRPHDQGSVVITDKDVPIVPYYLFAVNQIKDILVRLRNGEGVEWLTLPSKDYDLTEYRKQMVSEWPCEEVNKYGRKARIWKKINSNTPNEVWDLETYQVGMALIHPEISLKESSALPSTKYIQQAAV